MVNTRIKYIVYNHSGGGVRHHHFGVQNNIVNEADGMAAPGDTLNALGFPSLPFNGANLPFAFMSVHGAADGNHLYTSPGNQTVPVGTSDVDILVVYAPVGGIGGVNGGPGVWVDAFNVDVGDFSDSDFIQVLTPPTPPDTLDAAKSAFANSDGGVSTAAAENLRAFPEVDGAPFLEWKKIVPVATLEGSREVDLAAMESGEIWFAFYQTVPPGTGILRIHDLMEEALGTWVNDDYCGTPYPHHIGPSGPVFAITVKPEVRQALPPAQRDALDGLSKEYPGMAKAAYADLSRVAGLLGNIAKIVSQAKGQ